MKILYVLTLIIILSVTNCITGAFAEVKQDNSGMDFYFSLGTKGVYSSGVSETYSYNKSDITGGFKSDFVDMSAFIRRYFHYQIADGNGNYEYLSFNEAGISLDVYLFEIINMSGRYSRAITNDNNFKKNNYGGDIVLDLEPVTLSADYSFERMEYEMASNSIRNEKTIYWFEFELLLKESLYMDLSYTYDNNYFNVLGYNYYKNIFRAGLTIIPVEYLFLIAGISGGKDSADYSIYGTDCGITFLFFSRYKLFLIYSFTYYYPSQSDSTNSSGGSHSGHGPGSGENPYLSTDKAGEPYSSHVVSLGMSVTF